MEFSLAVKLADLDDFLKPSQECMVVEQKQERPRLLRETNSSKETKVESLKAATVSLADCLACSGCVTTAEAVLIDSHNYQTLLDKLGIPSAAMPSATGPDGECPDEMAFTALGSEEPRSRSDSLESDRRLSYSAVKRPVVVLSMSGVSEAALMAYYGVTNRDAFYEWLREALLEHGIAETFSMDVAEVVASVRRGRDGLSSHCPGVVLYAEKSGNCANINTSPPSQIWQGLLVKTMYSELRRLCWGRLRPLGGYCRDLHFHSKCFDREGEGEEDEASDEVPGRLVYHVVVSSCLDKKLETVRPEFSGLVELGLTTQELIQVLKHFATTYAPPPRILGTRRWDLAYRLSHLYGLRSYRFSLLRANGGLAAQAINDLRAAGDSEGEDFGCSGDSLEYRTTRGYNIDHTILSAAGHGATGSGVVQIATGLRNLKNFCGGSKTPAGGALELLACPKGCFSGIGHAEIFAVPGNRARAEEIYATTPRWVPLDLERLAEDATRRWPRPMEYVIAPLEKTNNSKW
ncbi:iron only hydrogenase large subunit, carboxy-terminal domain protein [Gregarina niphandrodes]|uniref:Iron only hydrogenase large subunit, carboxy-terminal domain protein n=1 Tax=Gregarina niphandrodes TaxID=110365 RepID=A0A023B3Q6_GRENI|nr:iron only hydrogenase large subunit, carboxy-terminal domain protein [Gregarina niphandrodes]EZG55517.1 iron only hydrogenase large subunit, carboxy-terminal domain protein [Gregarina niphandrodes]|eukprot:XP_011131503.1 iron only hydrogenase large subunit, carboxy-terminal domain protein [Gregarina niphandrodes]